MVTPYVLFSGRAPHLRRTPGESKAPIVFWGLGDRNLDLVGKTVALAAYPLEEKMLFDSVDIDLRHSLPQLFQCRVTTAFSGGPPPAIQVCTLSFTDRCNG